MTGLFTKLSFAGGLKSFFRKDSKMIQSSTPIDFQWPTLDPFLFCVHHFDHYPVGNKNLGLDEKYFIGRNIGQDFELKDGFRLYHGEEIPGFPVHPHRGFETITIVRKGYVDHADSLGCAGRYGEGDVQWMTAGAGVQHSEMFPLIHQDKENTLELFQIWLNLPAKNKMVKPEFKMLWANTIPRIKSENCEVSLISGSFQDQNFYAAPKNSWAADNTNEVNILLVKLQKGGKFNYPKANRQKNRMLYFFEGSAININGNKISRKTALQLDSSQNLLVESDETVEFLLLDAIAINEPVAQHGPFVMNNRQEIIQAFTDFQNTQFGGWKWPRRDMIHGPNNIEDKTIKRFAQYADGSKVSPTE